jgi:hypothetical protein
MFRYILFTQKLINNGCLSRPLGVNLCPYVVFNIPLTIPAIVTLSVKIRPYAPDTPELLPFL